MTTPINRKRRLIIFIGILIAIGTGIGVYAHKKSKIFKAYSVGVTTNGQEVSIAAIYLDNKWAIPGGVSISGTWRETKRGASLFNKPLPKEIYINWKDLRSKRHYDATIDLSPTITRQAQKLPPIHLDVANNNLHDIELIIGLKQSGKVVVWLSNAPHQHNLTGRVMYVVGRAQGHITQSSAPYYPSASNH